ncbi:MAG: polysaccharide deacetylase family protein [Syntrophobacteria bacterium]
MENILTVDLEDWFHICEVEHLLPRRNWDRLPSTVVADSEKLLSLLEQSGSQATFFVLGYVAEKYPELIRLIHQMGHEIAYHGWDHELIYNLALDDFRQVLRRGISCIENLVGRRPVGFRAPQWSINDRSVWALEILAEEGFVYDSSMAPLRIIGSESYPRNPWQVSTATGHLWELPPLTLKTPFGRYPAGGSWGLRCLPYPLIKQRVQKLNERRKPALFYFHPREFGGKRSVPGLPPSKKFALYGGIWRSGSQLARLLADFSFTSIENYLDGEQSPRPPFKKGGS